MSHARNDRLRAELERAVETRENANAASVRDAVENERLRAEVAGYKAAGQKVMRTAANLDDDNKCLRAEVEQLAAENSHRGADLADAADQLQQQDFQLAETFGRLDLANGRAERAEALLDRWLEWVEGPGMGPSGQPFGLAEETRRMLGRPERPATETRNDG